MLQKIVYSVAAALCALACGGCAGRPEYVAAEGVMLGTTFRISADVRGLAPQELYAAAMAIDREAKADWLDAHIAYYLHLADSIGALSGGAYDVPVKPLVEAWGFAGHDAAERPDVDSLLQFVGREKVRIEDGRLVKDDPRVQLDFNSVAKGYTVDLLAALVEKHGAENYLVDIGGEIRCKGRNAAGQPWRIGVETPFDGNDSYGRYVHRRVRMTSGGLATSGNYRRYYIDADGRKVAHTIDPRTGRSALSRLLSVTAVADDCATADALGTMFLAMGADEALARVREMPGAKVYFILAGEGDAYEEYVSPAMEALMMN